MTKRKPGTRPGDFIVGRLGPDGTPSTDVLSAMWTDFLNGTWQTSPPTTPGVYPVANRKGKLVGEALFKEDCSGDVVCLTHQNWDGWFYSRAMPLLPNRPPETWPSDSPLLRLITSDELSENE